MELAIVTGGGSGIGRALALRLVQRGYGVLITGRRAGALEETRALAGTGVEVVAADVADPRGRERVRDAVGERRVRVLVHNAGVLEPIGPLAELDLAQWRGNLATNVEAPLFLTQALLPRLRGGGRVLHISSGAAHHGYPGWGAYCTAKAALHMLYLVWREELDAADVAVASLRPGVVDTPMQALIRTQSPERFPRVQRFRDLKAGGQLRDPDEVARFALWLLTEPSAQEFVRQEWDVGDPEHEARWRNSGV